MKYSVRIYRDRVVSISKSLITVWSTIRINASLYPSFIQIQSLLKPGPRAVETSFRPIPDEEREAHLRLQSSGRLKLSMMFHQFDCLWFTLIIRKNHTVSPVAIHPNSHMITEAEVPISTVQTRRSQYFWTIPNRHY